MRYVTNSFVIVIIYLVTAGSSFSEVSSNAIAGAIPDGLEHPYLFFSNEDLPEIHKRIESDQKYGDIFARCLAEANRQLHTPVRSWEDYVKEHGSNAMARFRREQPGAAMNLAFVFQITGDDRYAVKAFEYADAVCAMPYWRYHDYAMIYHRVWPYNVPDDQPAFGYDIIAGDISREMAVIYDWLYPALDKQQRDRIRGVLLEKCILPVRGGYRYHWWTTAYRCNWCSVCFSGLGCAAMTLLAEDPELIDVIAVAYNGISGYLSAFGVDGGWQEGVSYWNYGFRQSIYFAEAARRITNDTFNLFEHRTLAKNTVNFPVFTLFPNNKSVYFSDSKSRRPGLIHILNRMAPATGSGMAAWYRENFFGAPSELYDIIWPESGVTPLPPDHESHHFRSIGWVVMRTDFTNEDYSVVACKAGYNDDPHHGHLDCGTFTIQWKDQQFISEVGLYGYDLLYFGEDRWENPQASSIGHNVVFVNGELQIPAKLKNKPWCENVGGEVIEFRSGKERDYTLLDPSGAYPGKELTSWRRHIIYEKPVITIVLDEIGSSEGAEIALRFHSECETRIDKDWLLLEGNDSRMALIPVATDPQVNLTFREGRHAFQRVREDTDFSWIPYNDLITTALATRTVIGTVIFPVADGSEAKRVTSSMSLKKSGAGGLVLSFITGGKRYVYTYAVTYNDDADGLRLSEAVVTSQ